MILERLRGIAYRSSSLSGDRYYTLRSKQKLFFLLGFLPFMGIIMVLICALNFISLPTPGKTHNPYEYWVTVGYGLLIGGAAYVAGGFGGFLFGLPRYLSNPDSQIKDYSRNDNLIQISDWLTKIIVGLGLTNLHKFPQLLQAFGENAKVLFGDGPVGAAVAQCILIYFLVCGFLFGYLWTNIQYIPILSIMDKVTGNLASEKEEKSRAANAIKEKYTDSINSSSPNAFSTVEQIQKTFPNSRALSLIDFSALLDRAKQKMQKGMEKQKSLPDNMKDPNKNEWGGKSEANDRRITASVNPIDDNDLFNVELMVTSTSPTNRMNEGDAVLFTLHNTFRDPYKFAIVKDGKAQLELISYGAFTVGVFCDNGLTELECDLSLIPGAPEKFVRN